MSTSEGRLPRIPVTQSAFERDVNRLRKRGKNMSRLFEVIEILCQRRPLESRHRDHALTGDWKGYRDCHIEPDWVLIYRVDDTAREVILARTGSHADLFD